MGSVKEKNKKKLAINRITSYSDIVYFKFLTRDNCTINLDTFVTEQDYNFRKFCNTCTKEKERVVTKLTTIVLRRTTMLVYFSSINDEQFG